MKTTQDYSTILCNCKDSEHMIVLHYMDDEEFGKEIYMEYHLPLLPFWSRLLLSIKYLFGFRSKYGAYGELIITKHNYKEFKPIIDFFETNIK